MPIGKEGTDETNIIGLYAKRTEQLTGRKTGAKNIRRESQRRKVFKQEDVQYKRKSQKRYSGKNSGQDVRVGCRSMPWKGATAHER